MFKLIQDPQFPLTASHGGQSGTQPGVFRARKVSCTKAR